MFTDVVETGQWVSAALAVQGGSVCESRAPAMRALWVGFLRRQSHGARPSRLRASPPASSVPRQLGQACRAALLRLLGVKVQFCGSSPRRRILLGRGGCAAGAGITSGWARLAVWGSAGSLLLPAREWSMVSKYRRFGSVCACHRRWCKKVIGMLFIHFWCFLVPHCCLYVDW